jgi:hypothetical protein
VSDVTVVVSSQGPAGPPMPAVRLATAAVLPAYTAGASGLTFDAAGLLAIDGEDVVENTDVLVQHEGGGTSIYNRIYTVSEPGDGSTQAVLLYKQNVAYKIGMPVVVGLGTANEGKLFRVATDGTITPGATAITWQEIVTGGGGGADDQTAAEVPFTPAGSIAATDVQAALVELDSEVVHLAGAETIAGTKTFSSAIVAGSIGPAAQAHTLPAVTSDTIALLAAAQTLTNKTLTSPVINVGSDAQGDIYYRNASGAFARLAPGTSGHVLTTQGAAADPIWAAQSGGSPFVVDDATNNDVTDVIAVRHTTSGTAAANIAAGLLFQTEDTAGNTQDTARIAGILTTATSGSEVGGVDFYAWSGGALTNRMRLWGNGGLSINNTLAPAAAGIGLLRDTPIYGGNAANSAYNPLIQMSAGTQVLVGSSTTSSQIAGSSVTIFSSGAANCFASGGFSIFVATSTEVKWGHNDATATPSNHTHRGPNAAGTNIAGAVETWIAPRGTGTGAAGIFRIQGGEVGSSGTTIHTLVDYADFQDTATNDEAAFLIRVRKGGVYTKERVTLVAGGSVAASGRNFLSVS